MFREKRLLKIGIIVVILFFVLMGIIIYYLSTPSKHVVQWGVNSTGNGVSVVWGESEPQWGSPLIVMAGGEEILRSYVNSAPPSPYPVSAISVDKKCKPYELYQNGTYLEVRTPKIWIPFIMADDTCAHTLNVVTWRTLLLGK